jgi:uncharacterized protein
MLREHIHLPLHQLAEFCKQHHIQKLSIFGSALREDFQRESDVDVLVEFEPGTRVSLFDLGGMQVDLSEIIGREVDLKTPQDLSRYFRQEVLDTAEVIYVRKA